MFWISAAVLTSLLLGGSAATPLEKRAGYYKTAFRNGNYPLDVVDQLEADTMPKVSEWVASKSNSNGCTLENAAVRKEW